MLGGIKTEYITAAFKIVLHVSIHPLEVYVLLPPVLRLYWDHIPDVVMGILLSQMLLWVYNRLLYKL